MVSELLCTQGDGILANECSVYQMKRYHEIHRSYDEFASL